MTRHDDPRSSPRRAYRETLAPPARDASRRARRRKRQVFASMCAAFTLAEVVQRIQEAWSQILLVVEGICDLLEKMPWG
ncbi:hypothetical protein [Microbacterium sp. NPDC089695]|uniref:hypothetical protein n=1 Tax=Microbacterium sp. NPDC089695 TaxID=3364198 RepID=UPI00380FBC2A